ncbi:hypothetical protein GALMADRAFT_131814 [Galerina marginata CBS 339.88]|uniref:Uncharacterized protein n=1 Tax=Galerina marginata (strain CBS 339.88) TaxID=685588 RepID=A0A067TPH7_GALM3|nr:hypothetical protein GALMADRAFT_131814 [Galerina marginata CBS 339.88]
MDNYIPQNLHFDYLVDLNSLPVVSVPGDFVHYSQSYGGQPQNIPASPLPLHAPVPSAMHHVSLLQAQMEVSYGNQNPDVYYCGQQLQSPGYTEICEPQESDINLDYCSTESLQPTFPTPSELLAELAAKGLPATSDEFGSDVRSESASKARRRAMAKSIGFIPTDPDTISSHEKKRHYLECLEQYITYLREQFDLIGATPANLERVGSYRGLTSKSIRTLLVHMENNTRRLNLRTLAEEQKFVKLRDEINRRQRPE